MAEPKQQHKERVLAKYPSVRKYRVRLIETERGKMLDIREHITSDSFTGFTRRGVRLAHPLDVIALTQSLTEVLTPPQSGAASAAQ